MNMNLLKRIERIEQMLRHDRYMVVFGYGEAWNVGKQCYEDEQSALFEIYVSNDKAVDKEVQETIQNLAELRAYAAERGIRLIVMPMEGSPGDIWADEHAS